LHHQAERLEREDRASRIEDIRAALSKKAGQVTRALRDG
jgi:hypothetical protein